MYLVDFTTKKYALTLSLNDFIFQFILHSAINKILYSDNYDSSCLLSVIIKLLIKLHKKYLISLMEICCR